MYKEIVEEAWAEFGFATKQEAMKKCMLGLPCILQPACNAGVALQP
jgi:hypothetical protein